MEHFARHSSRAIKKLSLKQNKYLDELSSQSHVLASKQAKGSSSSTSSPSSTDPVDIVLSLGGQVEVEDALDIFDIKTSRSDISCNKDVLNTILELLDDSISFILSLVTVDTCNSMDSISLKISHNIINSSFSLTEDNHS